MWRHHPSQHTAVLDLRLEDTTQGDSHTGADIRDGLSGGRREAAATAMLATLTIGVAETLGAPVAVVQAVLDTVFGG